jgi:hypothetical protein
VSDSEFILHKKSANHPVTRALPILRQLGAQSGSSMLRGGDFSMLKVWAGLEARSFLQASIEDVSLLITVNR